MKYRLLILLILAVMVFAVQAATADEVLYARYPALSPDGQTIAFTYQGDIWMVPVDGGQARRLTVHEAEDIRPQFSPDGKWVLFSSRRFNNYDVFVIPSQGGTARQLTFHSADDYASGWFPGSDSVVFTSSREGWRDIYKISIDGGMPIGLINSPAEQEYGGRISPDGRYLLFNTGSGLSRWWRRDLRSTGNADIYLQDRTAKDFSAVRLADYVNHDIWPVLNQQAGEVYFVSCRGDWAQVWKVPAAGGEAVQMTNFGGDGVQWLNSNPQGTKLVFEQGFHVWTLDPSQGQPKQVPITISSDERDNLVEKKVFEKDVDWFALSPDGKKIATVIHGEIFVLPSEEPKEGKRVTFTPARERNPVWGPDSKTIYYASDRNGNYDIFSADVTTGVEKQLSDSPDNEVKPVVSPDGRYLAYYSGLHQIMRYDLESGKGTVWVNGGFFDLAVEPTTEYGWSPDSKWLTFSMASLTGGLDINVVDFNGEIHNISLLNGASYRPRFSQDGKVVYFSKWTRDNLATYKVDLVHKPVEFVEAAFDSLFVDGTESKDDKKDSKKADKKEEKKIPSVTIDFDRIALRRSPAFSLDSRSEYPVLNDDGSKYYFVALVLGKPEIWSVNTKDDPDLKQLTHSGKSKMYLRLSPDGKNLYYLEDGVINRIPVDGGSSKALRFKAAMDVDLYANNMQKYNETWQMLNTYFYDSTFRGVDWKAVREKYEPIIGHIRTKEEFRNLEMELMGELMASHIYIYPREERPVATVVTGETGIDLDYGAIESSGAYRIRNVLPESPAELAGIRAGQYITAINGETLTPQANVYELLAGSIDKRLVLAMSEKPGGEGKDIEVKPVSLSKADKERYIEWVSANRRMVDSLSKGRLAYLHIPAMNAPSQKVFEEELTAIAEPKEALVLDIRNNGGGWIAVNLLGELVKSPYIMRAFRGQEPVSENKLRSVALEKPIILLINNYSGSNSEIFAEGFRKLGLGKIVGTPTGGGVIGTAQYALIDGTVVRRPSTGAFTTEMEDTEEVPRQPDILVELLPNDYLNGRDPQLVKAVQELLSQMGE